MRLTRILLVVVGLLAVTACTPEQIAEWHRWHDTDPAAAEAFLAQPWVQDELAHHAETYVSDRSDDSNNDSNDGGQRSVWDRIAECESNGNWDINTGNGYYGGLQFALESWRATGGEGYPHHASRAEQIRRAEILLDMQGWGAWPTCSRQLGLR
jgi:hypothetical protein